MPGAPVPAPAPARVPVPAVGLGEVFVDLLLAAVLFVVVIAVTAVVMSILQAVLPHGDTEADALAAAEEREHDDPGDGAS